MLLFGNVESVFFENDVMQTCIDRWPHPWKKSLFIFYVSDGWFGFPKCGTWRRVRLLKKKPVLDVRPAGITPHIALQRPNYGLLCGRNKWEKPELSTVDQCVRATQSQPGDSNFSGQPETSTCRQSFLTTFKVQNEFLASAHCVF